MLQKLVLVSAVKKSINAILTFQALYFSRVPQVMAVRQSLAEREGQLMRIQWARKHDGDDIVSAFRRNT